MPLAPYVAPMRREYQLLLVALGSAVVLMLAARNVPAPTAEIDRMSITGVLLQIAGMLIVLTFGAIFFALQSKGLAPWLTVLPPSDNLAQLGIGFVSVAIFAPED